MIAIDWGGRRIITTKGQHQQFLDMMELFCFLIVVVVTQICACVK